MEDTAMNGYEIEQNKLIIFKKSSESNNSQNLSDEVNSSQLSQKSKYLFLI